MTNFDDIRPYYDEEIPAAMQRIAASKFFPMLAYYVFPDRNPNDVKQELLSYKTIREFQLNVMYIANEQILKNTTSKFICRGTEYLRRDKPCLYVSNHRDIMLDASLLQNVLVDNVGDTSQITFGANLMSTQLIVDIGKSNKMFRVERGGNMKDFYMSSRHLSEYIRHCISDVKQSVWIAQRNGRTKDGNDQTDQGIIKMFCLSKPMDKINALAELNIVPVSISYEWESCDILKALEIYESRNGKYVKKPGEDLNSIVTGIQQFKGEVNLNFCKPITREELRQFDRLTNNEYHKRVAQLIDKRIIANYTLTPNNFIAHDLRYGQEHFADRYTPEQREAFIQRTQKLKRFDIAEPDVLLDIFLGIYANPVTNSLSQIRN